MKAMTVNPDFSIPEIFDPFFLELLHRRWTDAHLSLGVEIIDAQHLWLVGLLYKMEIMQNYKDPNVRLAKMTAYARELLNFLKKHLDLEHRVITAAEMPRSQQIIQEQLSFWERLQTAFKLNQEGGINSPEAFVELFKSWLERHIKEEDAHWKLHLSKKHFNPSDFVRAVVVDIEEEAESPHALLYRQLIVAQEVIPGIRKAVLDDLFLLWKRFDVCTKIPLIDMQHLWLFKMVVEVEGMLHISFDERRAHLEKVLGELIEYVGVHFASEEGLMEKVGYATFRSHRKLHDDFRRTVYKLKDEYYSGNHHALSGLVSLLRQWLLTHIVIEDSKFARFCSGEIEKTVVASRQLIREKQIKIPRDQVLVYSYITARSRAEAS